MIDAYRKNMLTQDGLGLSRQVISSILLYIQDMNDIYLSEKQRNESVEAGKRLIEAVITSIRTDLPIDEIVIIQKLMFSVLGKFIDRSSTIQVEHDLIVLLEILNTK
jgi:hypothetical protein